MTDVTVKRVDEMESIWGGSFVRARASLGASSFGMNIWNFPPDWQEVYTALSGRATLHDGETEYVIEPGVFARVGPAEKRRITTAAEGVQLLCIGGAPGKTYEPLPIVELGGPTGF